MFITMINRQILQMQFIINLLSIALVIGSILLLRLKNLAVFKVYVVFLQMLLSLFQRVSKITDRPVTFFILIK